MNVELSPVHMDLPRPYDPFPISARQLALGDDSGELSGVLMKHPVENGVVLVPRGDGDVRDATRSQVLANLLYRAGFSTLHVDLLRPAERSIDARNCSLRREVRLMSRRLVDIMRMVRETDGARHLKVGVLASNTATAVTLFAAAQNPTMFNAVVSCSGRPDLAGALLTRVVTPVLLVVGEHDPSLIEHNQHAHERLAGRSRLSVVPGATRSLGEPGKLVEVAQLAQRFFHESFAEGSEA